MKSALQTSLLPDGITFEGPLLGRMPTLKFEDWDHMDSENFPHIETTNLMKQSMEGPTIMLVMQKWLHSVEKVRLLHLLWLPHFHRAPITILVITQLCFLVYDGYLWLEQPIPITANLIHRISKLPCNGKDSTMIAGKSSDLALTEAMKKKYKVKKKRRGYVITSIKDKGVHVATQLLARKVMIKCHDNEVIVPVVALAEQCVEGIQFNWAKFLCEEFLLNFHEAQE